MYPVKQGNFQEAFTCPVKQSDLQEAVYVNKAALIPCVYQHGPYKK